MNSFLTAAKRIPVLDRSYTFSEMLSIYYDKNPDTLLQEIDNVIATPDADPERPEEYRDKYFLSTCPHPDNYFTESFIELLRQGDQEAIVREIRNVKLCQSGILRYKGFWSALIATADVNEGYVYPAKTYDALKDTHNFDYSDFNDLKIGEFPEGDLDDYLDLLRDSYPKYHATVAWSMTNASFQPSREELIRFVHYDNPASQINKQRALERELWIWHKMHYMQFIGGPKEMPVITKVNEKSFEDVDDKHREWVTKVNNATISRGQTYEIYEPFKAMMEMHFKFRDVDISVLQLCEIAETNRVYNVPVVKISRAELKEEAKTFLLNIKLPDKFPEYTNWKDSQTLLVIGMYRPMIIALRVLLNLRTNMNAVILQRGYEDLKVKYGLMELEMPTFEEFCKNHHLYGGEKEAVCVITGKTLRPTEVKYIPVSNISNDLKIINTMLGKCHTAYEFAEANKRPGQKRQFNITFDNKEDEEPGLCFFCDKTQVIQTISVCAMHKIEPVKHKKKKTNEKETSKK